MCVCMCVCVINFVYWMCVCVWWESWCVYVIHTYLCIPVNIVQSCFFDALTYIVYIEECPSRWHGDTHTQHHNACVG